MLDDRPRRRGRRSGIATGADTLAQLVGDIIAVGRHGDLTADPLHRRFDCVYIVRFPPERVIDDKHPAPGVLLPYRTVTVRRRRHIRFLSGAHDIEAFTEDTCGGIKQVVRDFHAEVCNQHVAGKLSHGLSHETPDTSGHG